MPEKLLLKDLLDQLKRWGDKGQLKKNTARALKSSSERVLSVLGSPDQLDIREVDLDEAIQRFHNLNPDVTPASLREYKSRVEKALRMFVEFKRDPVNWKPETRQRSSSQEPGNSKKSKATPQRTQKQDAVTSRDSSPQGIESSSTQTLTIPFPLRPNLTVSIAGLPRDLKTAECERLSAFLRALAIDYQSDHN